MISTSSDWRAYVAEWRDKERVGGLHRPVADPTQAAATGRRHLGTPSALLYGVVVDGVAPAGCYKVLPEGGRIATVCAFQAPSSAAPLGARAVATLAPGTGVWFVRHPQTWWGTIVAVEPAWALDPGLKRADRIHQASRTGVAVEGMARSILGLAGGGGVVDWSAGRPADQTLAGEWGAIAETGVRCTVDPFMAQLAADEACGFTAFYADLLARVVGVNLQEYSGGSEREWLVDQGEIVGYAGWTPYPWEQRGSVRPGSDPFRDVAPADAQAATPYYATVEPAADDQMPVHRVVDLAGYPGQGGHRFVLLPPGGDAPLAYGDGRAPGCVAEDFHTLAGRRVIRAAGGITLVRQPAIPAPRRTARPEDERRGDEPGGYRYAGLAGAGSGPAHAVAAAVAAGDPAADAGAQRAAAALDSIAYVCNWEGVHALHYHARDWSVPEEADTAAGTNQAAIDFASLADAPWLPPPAAFTQVVDHRYGAVAYTPNTQFLDFTEDGGVVLRGGNGEAIVLSGGNIRLSCPGNVEFAPGRSVVALAGYDVILRAKNAADLSAGRSDVRIKAERHVQVLAGNGGESGALLLESRAPGGYGYEGRLGTDARAGGIQLKAASGDVAAWAKNVYLRTGGGDVEGGAIVLDGDAGAAEIQVVASTLTRYLTGAAVDAFGPAGRPQAVNRFAADGASLAGSLVVAGGLEVDSGGIAAQGDVLVLGGHVFTQEADAYQGKVAPLPDEAALDGRVQASGEARARAAADAAAGWQADFARAWYGDGGGGSDAAIRAAGFSFRTDAQYRTAAWRLYEDPWQQLARLSGAPVAAWTENPVRAQGTATYPYPGAAAWAGRASYRLQDLALHDAARGVAAGRRSAAYQDPRFPASRAVVPDGAYMTIL